MNLTANNRNFAKVSADAKIKGSVFNRDSTHKTTFNAGELIPIYIDEVLPGDTFDVKTAFVCRTTTPIHPVMDYAIIDINYFFVPNRLIWDGWTALHGENKASAWTPSSPPALVPTCSTITEPTRIPVGSVADYLGLPTYKDTIQADKIIDLPFRAYRLIWNEWYRDQNLQAPITVDKGNSGDSILARNLKMMPLKANKKHDYFTSCLPAPQKADAVQIPVFADSLYGIPVMAGEYEFTNEMRNKAIDNNIWFVDNVGDVVTSGNLGIDSGGNLAAAEEPFSGAVNNVAFDNLYANTDFAQLGTISELRSAFQLQKLFERDARGGTRYTEILSAHFGVDSPDSRLQRPEYLGGHREQLNSQQVAQTSSTDETSPQGNLAAYSLTTHKGSSFKQSFVEHGFVLGLAVVRNVKSYSQGIERFWSRRDRFDYYYPALAHISEQPVYTKEIFDQDYIDEEVFGYQEAWAEYRYKPNRTSSYMRPGIDGSLASWHYGDYYDEKPSLSSSWMYDNTKENLDRTLAVQSTEAPQILLDCLIKNRSTRPMPVFSVPGLVDHF